MNMHAKMKSRNMHIYFEKKYSKVLLCEILYNALLSNQE
jgi:hypothetical protein